MLIDIRTRPVADDARIVVARPGANYRLFNAFVNFNVVGPDLPGLYLEDEDVDPADSQMTQRILRSKEIRKWLGNPNRANYEAPSLDLETYDPGADDRGLSQFLRLTDFYFRDAKKGDLVAVPPQQFGGKVHIGEFADDEIRNLPFEQLGDYRLPVRNVKWLGTIDKIDLPARIIDALRKPTALLLVSNSEKSIFLGAAFRNYYTKGLYCSVFDVTSPDFDTTAGSIIPGFFNFVAANTRRIEGGATELLSFGEGAFVELGNWAPDLAIDIQSPGILSLASEYISPIVASALLALALSVGPSAADPAVMDKIVIGNSAAGPDDPCAALVKKQVSTHVLLLGYDKWAEACELLKKAQNSTGLESEAHVQE